MFRQALLALFLVLPAAFGQSFTPAGAAEGPSAADGEAAREQVLAALRSGGQAERNAAFRELLRMGRRAGPLLAEALSIENDAVRTVAAQLAGELGAREAVPGLVQLLGSRSANAQHAAVDALGKLKDPRALSPLLELLGRVRQAPSKCAVLNALGSLGDRESQPYVESLLSAADPSVRCCAAGALGLLGDGKGLGVALEQSRSEDPRVQRAALEALGQIRDEKALEALEAVLAQPKSRNRAAARIAKGKIELKGRSRKERLRLLSQELGDEDELVQDWAARELANLGDPDAVSALKAHLRAPDGRARRPILVQLYRLGVN
ncbi:MAG: HEAT repeat domain-containing protein [Deltaproteobacteria bacterium]|nr:HEAT repeat domain-containing protein [Deltaproteobacteria bacterium]